MANSIFWAISYESSWWGVTKDENNIHWGSDYPYNVDGNFIRASSTLESADETFITADQTQY